MRRSREETNETIHTLLQIAQQHFTKRGYSAVVLEEVAQAAGMTRGAVYHHFRSKKGLFQHVLEAVQVIIGQHVEKEAMKSDDPWEQLHLGCRGFLEAAVEPHHRRIVLIDGPAVLGWETWRRLDEQNSMSHLREQLAMMQEQRLLKPMPLDALTHFLSGALNESALWIAESEDIAAAMRQSMDVLNAILEGIRT
ncbi:TetR/AcrR family transcriptional regulator [Paenibacillus senegalensis]|uniref:TetR/AcrR family transcriptional regulator n=1 Tax=Paenibacillus senegalensis TaxID=1465766 RepID=UPI0002882D28|nr:TetR/AcrR family transcriptional regulator [Paenibacillus senegalensis]